MARGRSFLRRGHLPVCFGNSVQKIRGMSLVPVIMSWVDRPPHRAQAKKRPEGDRQVVATVGAKDELVEAVSYTHLTLPTNREV